MKLKHIAARIIAAYAHRTGMVQFAITPEVDAATLATLPESQRGWYEADAAKPGTFKVNLSKVDVEDTGGLKTALQKERDANKLAKQERDRAIAEALAPYAGIDPVKTKALLSKFENEDEAALIAAGKIDEVIARRMEKQRTELTKQVEEAGKREKGALEVAGTFMERVLDNHVRQAAMKAGLHPSAVDDALLRARNIFSLNDEGEAVQFDTDGETPVLGKDGKNPFSPAEWIESMRETAPHWFPAGASGGGAGGGNKKPGQQDLSGLTPQERMTRARAAGGRK